jgi:ribosomal protein L28
MPGLKLEPASLDELRNLTGLLGLSLARIASYKANDGFNTADSDLDRGRKDLQSAPAKNDDVPEMLTESFQAGKSTNAEMEPINEVSAILSETTPHLNSSISEGDHVAETEDRSSFELPIKNAVSQDDEQTFTLEEDQTTDSRTLPINNEKTLLKALHPKKAVSRSRNQPRREIKSKGLTLEEYIGESVRQNLNHSPETLTPNASTLESKKKKDDEAQAHEHSILTTESVSLDQKHSFIPSFSDNNDSGLEALSIKDNEPRGEEDAQILGSNEERKVAVVDGNNVAWSVQKKRKPKLENILHLRNALVEQGYEVIIWVSAKLRHDIDRQAELEEMIRSNKILQAPAGTNDDKFILKTAERLGGYVVSNDQFRDFPKETWLQDRRLNYSIVGEEVFIVDSSRPKKKKTEKKKLSKESPHQSPSNLHNFVEDNMLVVTKLSELHQRVTQTLEGLKGGGNDGGLTHTGMRVAGRLVVKDLIEFLETAETLKGSPNSVKNALKELRQYIVEQLGISTETDMNPEELWKRIPGGAEKSSILLEMLNESLADYRENHRQESKTLQPA